MKNILKKTLSLTLGLALALGTLSAGSGSLANAMDSFTVKASAAETATSGKCGENLTWNLDDEGTLTISGTGDMDNYGGSPWYNYDSVKEVIIKSGVTSIGDGAFAFCSSIESVTIPDTVVSIGIFAFDGCTSLTDITVNQGNPVFDSRGNCNAIIDTRSNTLVWGCKNTIIPNSVIYIGEGAFEYCTSLKSITIPSSVTYIGSEAFYWCTSLENVSLPDSVSYIGERAFYECNLESITIPKGITSISEGAFAYCEIKSVSIPDGVTSIGDEAFYECDRLKNVTIPASVTHIGDRAFYGCWSLTSIIIPDGVISIGNEAFCGCYELKSVAIPRSVTSIGEGAFCCWDTISDVYYAGSEADRNVIKIGRNNKELLDAIWHYNTDNNDVLVEPKPEKKPNFIEKMATSFMSVIQSFFTFISNIFKFR